MGPFTLATALLATLAAADVATPNPRITSISFSGSGCAKDPKFSGSLNDATITYNDFAISLVSPRNRTANCQVHLQAAGAGAGWQVALSKNVVKGHAVLPPGTQLSHYTTTFFSQDAGNTATIEGTIENSGSSTINQVVALVGVAGKKAWGPCTGSSGDIGLFNINFRPALTGDDGDKAYFEALTQEWDLDWRRC